MLKHHKIISMILCFCIILCLFPGNLYVKAVNEIGTVEVTGVTAPIAGATPDYSVSVPASAGYTVDQVIWKQQDYNLSSSDQFVAGEIYELSVILKSGTDSVFKLDEVGGHIVTATIDGLPASCAAVAGKDTAEYISITVSYTAKEATSDRTSISRVTVYGLMAPVAGSDPDFSASTSDSTYTVNKIVWTHLNPAGNTGSSTMSSSDRFTAGGRYQVQVILKANAAYAFASSVSGVLNGTQVSCQSVPNQDSSQYVRLVYEYALSGGNQITNVEIGGLTTPIKGGRPDFTVTVASTANYTVNSLEWKYWKNTDAEPAPLLMPTQNTFETGYTYQVNIVLKAKSNASFATDSNGNPIVTGTLNGQPTLPGVAVAGKSATQYISICHEFSLDSTVINNVVITGVIDPFVGSRPNALANVSKDLPYTVSEIYWEFFDDTQPPGEFVKMNSYALFATGLVYRVNVVLKANSGAEFALDENGEPTVTGTINDQATHPAQMIPGRNPAQYICVRYDFPILTEDIYQVDVFDVDEPIAEQKPDMEAEVPEEALYLVDEVIWERLDNSKTPAKYVKMGKTDKFENNQDYRVTFILKAKEGGTFYVTDFGNLQVTATVNGQPTIPAEAVKDEEPTEFVSISYDFSLSTNAKLIKRVTLHDLQIPQVGEVPDFQVSPDAIAKYTVEEVIWEKLTSRQSSAASHVMEADDIFQEGSFYRVKITLKANEGSAFQVNDIGRPQVTVTLNNGSGMAAERVIGKSSEEYISISFVYGVYTVIDGGDSVWSPGKGALKFRFTGDFKNFSAVRIDGVLLDSKFYTASEGSTIIILSEEFLNTLQDGIYKLTIVYTDGQANSQFEIHGGNHAGGDQEKGISPWVWLLPIAVVILVFLFLIVFILKRRAEARVYEEEYEEYDEDDE